MTEPSAPPTRDVTVHAGAVALPGDLTLPDEARGLVVFVHGSGSSRFSPRNRYVAEVLNRAGLGTLLFDLLTEEEDRQGSGEASLRFDIHLLAERSTAAVDWLATRSPWNELPVGLFGASTGAAAALVTAAMRREVVKALVSRGGRPDLAHDALGQVRCPTLLIVGGEDTTVLRLNRQAAERLAAPHEVEVVAGATHLFEEPGALEDVADLACDWFLTHLAQDVR